ncbi:MAG: peroxiredoxin [Polyangiaceae bacterium]
MKRGSLLLMGVLSVACQEKGSTSASEPGAANSGAAAAQAPAAAASPTSLLTVGAAAPALEVKAHNGEVVDLTKLRGKPVVVYFYPKDDTPGCTVEAQGIRDDWSEFTKLNAVVIGVSTDDNESHKAFAEKHELPFLLLPDKDGAIAKAFGVSLTLGYAKRVSFVIDKAGKISKVFPNVTPKGHAKELAAAIAAAG